MPIIDVHCHLFNFSAVRDFYKKPVRSSDKKEQTDIGSFLECLAIPIEDIARNLLNHYPAGSIIVPLMMDFTFGGRFFGTTLDTFTVQTIELRLIRERFKREGNDCIYPFLAVDPRRPDLLSLVKQLVRPTQAFHGIKIYPPLGYLPSHPVLMEVFKHCEKKRIPVTVHCIPDSSIHCSIKKVEVKGSHPESGATIDKTISFRSANKCSNFFTNPVNWKPVLERYPELGLNFGHFGGFSAVEETGGKRSRRNNRKDSTNRESEWRVTIEGFMRKYPNVYADISFIMATITQSNQDIYLLNELIDDPVIGDRILYGSDFYMVYMATKNGFNGAFQRLQTNLAHRFNKIAWINPNRFLFGNPELRM